MVDSFVKVPTPTLFYDPWKSNEDTFRLVATINGDDPNHFKEQKLQHDECITVVKFPLD